MTYWEFTAAVTTLNADRDDDDEFDTGAPPSQNMIDAFRDKLR